MSRVILQDEKEGDLGDIELDRVPCPGEYCMFANLDSQHLYRVERVVWAIDDGGVADGQALPVLAVSKVRVIAENENWTAPGTGGVGERRWPEGVWAVASVLVGLGLMLYGGLSLAFGDIGPLPLGVAFGGLGWTFLGSVCVPCKLRRRSMPPNVVPLRRGPHKARPSA